MSLWKLIRHLKFRQILSLVVLFAKWPLMLYPTAKATLKTMRICHALYPEKHQGNGRGNAFRHALWNILITREAMKWNRNKQKSLDWAKIITDWHEKFAPNKEPARFMDLHNNAKGRELFERWTEKRDVLTDRYIVKQLKEAMAGSKKITGITETDYPGLVYIEEP